MFENMKRAWHQAVDNFWHELEGGEAGDDARTRAAYREVAAARNQMARLEREISECGRGRDHEREQARVCERREKLARDIDDHETARIAAEYRARHLERALVLDRKLEALHAERTLFQRDVVEMERALATLAADMGVPELDDLNRHPREDEFRTLEEAERARAAAERLEELRRRTQP
jgi:ABC-type phosphate transport system auxiliary subunit